MLTNAATRSIAASAVTGAIRDAARATHASFAYLLATAKLESGLDPKAASRSSSARGLFQFIDQTWLGTLKQAGPQLGYGRYAAAIVEANGRYVVPDAAARREIMALRNDPAATATMAGAFTRRNTDRLSTMLGRAPTEGELYIAHFLGPTGAAKLITLATREPAASAAGVFPKAANANRSIFFDGQGNPRTAAAVYGVLVGRYSVARAEVDGARSAEAVPLDQAVPPALAVAPAPATAPSAAVREQRPQAIFAADQKNRGGISRFIEELWSSRPRAAAALSGAAPPGAAAAPTATAPVLSLFTDGPTDAQRLFDGSAS